MKRWIYLMITLVLAAALWQCKLDDTVQGNEEQPGQSEIKLVINEFLASNDAANADENGEYDDWLELYNYGDDTVDIAGMYLTDGLDDLTKAQIPETNHTLTKIPPKGFLVLWADGQPEQGVLHLGFKLSSGGEDIAIVEENGRAIIDSYTFGPQTTDVSMGRLPDGSDNWVSFSTPTPGASNGGGSTNVAPKIREVKISPDSLEAGTDVVVSAVVTDENDNLSSVTITYGPEGQITTQKNMTAQDSVYSANLGQFDDGSRIFFFITAQDDEGLVATTDTLSFEVGYVAPVLFINEFLASNDTTNADENGEYDDWIEIYNPGNEPVDIGGFYISDDKTDITAWQIPTGKSDSTTVPAGGFLLLWADKQPEQGVLHVKIKLSSGGEDIVLTAPNGTTVIDSLSFGAQTTDVSMGRLPDGSDNWVTFDHPTPGASNQ